MRSAEDEFQNLIDEFADDPDYIAYGLVSKFVDDLCRAMEAQGVTRAELAGRLGVSPQYVTKFLNSTEKTSVYQLVRFAKALGMEVRLAVEPTATAFHHTASCQTQWPTQSRTRPWTPLLPEGGDTDDRGRSAA